MKLSTNAFNCRNKEKRPTVTFVMVTSRSIGKMEKRRKTTDGHFCHGDVQIEMVCCALQKRITYIPYQALFSTAFWWAAGELEKKLQNYQNVRNLPSKAP